MTDIFGSGNRKDKWVKKATEWINYLFNHKSDTLLAGQNITLTPDATNHTVTVSSTASGGASSLADLTDTDIDNPTDGQALVYDDGEWVNAPLPSAPVTDVEVDGTSVVNASGVAEIDLTDYAKSADLGTAAAKNYTASVTQNSADLVTSGAVWTAIDNLPEPMVFKGTLGTGGTITTLPTASTGNEGYTYKVITAGTYAGQSAKVGDVFVSNGSEWVLIPAGDTDSDTWRAIKVNGTQLLGSAISTGAVNFKGGTNVQISGSGNDVSVDVDTTFTEASTRTNIASGDSIKTILGKIKKFFTDLKAVAFSGSYNDLSDQPTIPTVGNGIITITQNGTSVGDFSMNQSGDETIALTDENVKITSTNPTSTTTYYPTWVDSSGTKGENINNGFAYQSRNGTTSQDGVAVVQAGNAIASGTANNKKGYFRVYNKNSNFASIGYNDSATSDTTHTLPATGGTIVNNNTFRSQATVTTTENGLMIAADKSKLNTLTQDFRGIVTVEAADSFVAGWRRFAKITASGNYGSALLAFRGGWSNSAPYVGTVLYTIRNNEAKLRILDGFGQPNNVHKKLRAVRISANNYYLEMYRSETSNANSKQYCDIVPISGTGNWTVTETSDTPPINNNATGANDYEISLMDEQFMPYNTNTGYIGTADKAWKEGYINNLHGNVDGSATKLTKTETVLQTNQVPYVSRASLSPEGFSGYIREMLIGGSVGWNQLVVNGNFASTSNWGTTGTGTTISASDNVLTVSSTTDGNMYSSQTFTAKTVTGHKYIFNAEAYSDYTSNLIIVYRGGGDANRIEFSNTVTGAYVKYNTIFECTNQSVMSQIRLLNRQHSSSNKFKNVYITDLTVLFGSVIADYIYNLEAATAGAGVSLLRSLGLFTEPYYAQDNGSIQSVCVKEKKIVGFNQWDEVWELGVYDTTTGQNASSTTQIRTKNLIGILSNTSYYMLVPSGTAWAFFYDSKNNLLTDDISGLTRSNNAFNVTNKVFTTPATARYMKFYLTATYGATYKNDICINISDTTKNGTYEPYHIDTIPLSATELRGVFTKDSSNTIYYIGDEYTSDGKLKRKFGIVDLGTLDWTITSNNRFSSETISTLKNVSAWNSAKSVCAKYKQATVSSSGTNEDKIYGIYGQKVYVNDTAYTDATTFTTAMDGVYLVYELATPTEETALSYQNPQYAKDGTEEFMDYYVSLLYSERNFSIPVGHVTEYMGTTSGKYQVLPPMPTDNFKYVLTADSRDISWELKDRDWIYFNTIDWSTEPMYHKTFKLIDLSSSLTEIKIIAKLINNNDEDYVYYITECYSLSDLKQIASFENKTYGEIRKYYSVDSYSSKIMLSCTWSQSLHELIDFMWHATGGANNFNAIVNIYYR